MRNAENFFHLHLVSDATGETLISVGRAVAAQYSNARAIEHLYPMVRNQAQLEKTLSRIDQEPGIVLYTFADPELGDLMGERCQALALPAVNVLKPVSDVFQNFLGEQAHRRTGAQYALNESYFDRIEAIHFALTHDDGVLPDDLEQADIILLGISRTTKTPTSIYLAQRGLKTANIPLHPDVPLDPRVEVAKKPSVVALVATTDRLAQVRQQRVLSFEDDFVNATYTDRTIIAQELSYTRRLCKTNRWPMIDVSRRSVEETAAEVIAIHNNRSA
ncbi:MAG: pyruvate, water dikinase regulatory protein [Pseudomonadota bacterium]